MSELKLSNAPEDLISSLKFSPTNPQLLLVSSWDSHVRLYNIAEDDVKVNHKLEAPLLDCCFMDASNIISGGLDKKLTLFNCVNEKDMIVGQHEEAVKCLEMNSEMNLIMSGSWDGSVKFWDARSPNLVNTLPQLNKVYTMSQCGDKLIVGTDQRKVMIWDLRNTGVVQQKRESSLKYQTRCIKAFPNHQGYVLGSIEGRVAVEYMDPSPEAQKNKYAFKCHRCKEGAVEKIYPVNAFSFHHVYSTFASGGFDGYVNIWDCFNKKRLCQFLKFPASISALCFDSTGSHLAIASSNAYEDPSIPPSNTPDEIFIRKVTDDETKPK